MTESRRERKKEETRKKLIMTAAELFRRQGFVNTAIDQITEAADVGKGTFYNYFDTKEAVLSAYIDGGSQVFLQMLPSLQQLPATADRLKAIMRESARWGEANPEFLRIDVPYRTTRNLGHPEFLEMDGLWNSIYQVLTLGQQAGDISDDWEVLELATYFYGLLSGVFIAWFDWPEGFSLTERLERMVEFFMHGAGVKK